MSCAFFPPPNLRLANSYHRTDPPASCSRTKFYFPPPKRGRQRARSRARERRGSTLVQPTEMLPAADDRHTLDFDQQPRLRETGNRDQRARRKTRLEGLLAQLDEAIAEPPIVDEDGHRHHVREARAAIGLDGLVQPGKNFPHLSVESRTGRAGLAAEPERLAALRRHRAREPARLRPLIRRITLLRHRVCGARREGSRGDETRSEERRVGKRGR